MGSSRSLFLLEKLVSTRASRSALCSRGGITASLRMPPEPAPTRRRRRRWLPLNPKRHASSSSSCCLLVLSLLLASCTLSLQQSDLAASAHAPPTLAGKVAELVSEERKGRGEEKGEQNSSKQDDGRAVAAQARPFPHSTPQRLPKNNTGRRRRPQAAGRGAPEASAAAEGDHLLGPNHK